MTHQPLVPFHIATSFFRLPDTLRGKQALRLFGAAVGAVMLLLAMTAIRFALPGGANADDGAPPLWLFLPMMATVVAASLSALIGGRFALLALRGGNRSGVLVLPFACALIATFFLLGELLFGHE